MTWYAHSGRDEGKADWQRLVDHSSNVATLAGEMGRSLGLEKAAFFAGLYHDLGKYNPDFQRRLEGRDVRVDHSTAGAQVLCGLAQGHDKAIAEIIAYAILGHHAGLPDRMNGTDASFDRRMEQKVKLDQAWQAEIGEAVSGLMPDFIKDFPQGAEELGFSLAFLGRMIFSCLVDADFRDTEQFYVALGEVEADRNWSPLATLIDDFTIRFDSHMAGFAGRGGELNALRRDILSHVRAKATEKPGLFTLTVPTGGGKTLASLGFALDHARKHGHSRIIYAIPFAEAWIETPRSCSRTGSRRSRLPRGGVDRNGYLLFVTRTARRRLPREAWIETSDRRSYSGCQHVASLAEAWIETTYRLRTRPGSRSPPSRRRGSKRICVQCHRRHRRILWRRFVVWWSKAWFYSR